MGNKFADKLAKLDNKYFVAAYALGYLMQILISVYRFTRYYDHAWYKLWFIISNILQVVILGWITGFVLIAIVALIKGLFDKNES